MTRKRPTPPRSLRMPAEWEPHAGTWFSWPHNRDTWPDGLEAAEAALGRAVRVIAEGEPVHLNVLDIEHERHVRSVVGAVENVHFHAIPTNDAWCRDHGPTCVLDDTGRAVAVDWDYNAWGGKYPPFDRDRLVARRVADAAGLPVLESEWILEGGAIESNGAGTILTTASCVLNPNRNPGRDRGAAEREFTRCLGAEQVIWLEGELAGDDTDGHIDNLARFAAEDLVLVPEAPGDPEHGVMFDRLADAIRAVRLRDGRPIRVERMPHPEPVIFEGSRLPASYANFYIANSVVAVPTYRCGADAEALAVLAGAFPDRTVEGVDCTEIIRGLGALHCLSQPLFSTI